MVMHIYSVLATSILFCPFMYQHNECQHSDEEVPFRLITDAPQCVTSEGINSQNTLQSISWRTQMSKATEEVPEINTYQCHIQNHI